MSAYPYIAGVWVAIGIVWLAASLKSKPATRTQTAGARIAHMSIMVPAFALLFSSQLRVGPLGWRVLPDWPALGWMGLALTVAGCAFAIWARLLLGGNWSATVTIKQDHKLVRRGPYTIVRHPIYSGALLAMLGTAMAEGEVRGILAFALAFIGWRGKSRIEEGFMIDQFGAEYVRYQREVKALIPFVY